MKPITITVNGTSALSSDAISSNMLDLNRWSDFKGYSILPAIKSATFIERTPEVKGTRIQVQNMDGSSHVEEIIEWNTKERLVLRFHEFSPPLKNLAEKFIEEWSFSSRTDGTHITRTMSMYPKGVLGFLFLLPISRLMKKAFEIQRDTVS